MICSLQSVRRLKPTVPSVPTYLETTKSTCSLLKNMINSDLNLRQLFCVTVDGNGRAYINVVVAKMALRGGEGGDSSKKFYINVRLK